jgi:hypothetical protein
MDVFSQMNSEINSQVLRLCESISKHFGGHCETNAFYKLWIDSLPKEVTEEDVKDDDE